MFDNFLQVVYKNSRSQTHY